MLFNSYEFIFVFLPAMVALFFAAGRLGRLAGCLVLVLGSLVFYAAAKDANPGLMLMSIAVNYLGAISMTRMQPGGVRTGIFASLVVLDLIVLSYFKYADFLIVSINSVFASALPQPAIPLPPGISFFTFTQIAFLVDAYRREIPAPNPIHYALFVTWFPHLIAGPILHHREMTPQFSDPRIFRLDPLQIAVGISLFAFGLFKKVILADGVAPLVGPAFAAAEPGFAQAWQGALAYTFQIYFDFSGYSDMAIGLSFIFGIRLPVNFNSPYKATSIIEFWRRWHMTLSRFLRDYLYFPLGGNRAGLARRHLNLAVTMILGGLWHGANWTFVAWGALHGAYLIINHAWRGTLQTITGRPSSPTPTGRAVGRCMTFLAVVVAWVLFRASTIEVAARMLGAMMRLDALPQLLLAASMQGVGAIILHPFDGSPAMFLALLCMVWLAPNTQEIFARFRPSLDAADHGGVPSPIMWQPTAAWAAVSGVVAAIAVAGISRHSEFLYFQF